MIHEELSGKSIGHLQQMIGCSAITGLKLALLLNFTFTKLQWKRVVRESHE